MIDTCDPTIATWSPHDNGETFIVTNVKAFESTIIPQFFKHSKFSSFVRQLNFYGFRKIRYAGEFVFVCVVCCICCAVNLLDGCGADRRETAITVHVSTQHPTIIYYI
jgi:hypothetical protein